ncbi:MAG: hypothetical protein NTV23_11390 [Propionibacteriales bacterium]|nr:hypothetical protein [Propionibacteriales bacterium]
MGQQRISVVTGCGAQGCASFGSGHNTHTVQATLAGTSPSGWSNAVVQEVNGLCVGLRLAPDGPEIVVWHHQSLAHQLGVGTAVRLHAARCLLEIGSQWHSVALADDD